MKKQKTMYLVLTACLVISIFGGRYFCYPFFWGAGFGASLMLMVLNYFGQRQLNKAVERLDKQIRDRAIVSDFKNLNK